MALSLIPVTRGLFTCRLTIAPVCVLTMPRESSSQWSCTGSQTMKFIVWFVLPVTYSLAKILSTLSQFVFPPLSRSINHSITAQSQTERGEKTKGCFQFCQRFQKIILVKKKKKNERSISVSSNWNIRDHLLRWSTYFSWNIPTEICHSIFDKTIHYPTSNLCREFRKGVKNGKSHSSWLAQLVQKMLLNSPQVFPLLSVSGLWFGMMESTQRFTIKGTEHHLALSSPLV